MAAAKENTYTQNRKINPQYTDKQIAKIIDDLLEWAYKDDGIYIASYVYKKYKRSKAWIYNLADHHKELKDALEVTRELIAAKVANHCFMGDRNSTFGEKILPIYCKDYKALKEWQAELAKQKDEQIKASADQIIQAIKDNKLLELLAQKDD